MAISSVKTLLPLDTFAKYAGIHPLHFNQVNVADLAPGRVCGDTLVQYSWQTADKVGRDEIAQAIADAEELLRLNLGFPIASTWIVDEKLALSRPANPGLYNIVGSDIRARPGAVKLDSGFVITGGIEAKTLIAAARPVVYSDPDGDAYFEIATATATTTVTEPQEIAIYYPGQGGASQYEIKPITVVIAGGVATITFKREQAVILSLLEELDASSVDGLVAGNFLTTVDVYRHYNDPATQVQFATDGLGWCYCGSADCQACGFNIQTGCMRIQDHRLGIVGLSPGTYDAVTGEYDSKYWVDCRAADRARVWYRAGWQLPSLSSPLLTMDPKWARAVTYLALSLLDRPICACDALESYTKHWSEDLALNQSTPSASSSFQIRKLLDNPIGTTRAAIFAWRLVQREKLGEAAWNA